MSRAAVKSGGWQFCLSVTVCSVDLKKLTVVTLVSVNPAVCKIRNLRAFVSPMSETSPKSYSKGENNIFFNQAQKRAATEEAEKQKKEEIKALQGQLAVLQEMQALVQVGRVGPSVQSSWLEFTVQTRLLD